MKHLLMKSALFEVLWGPFFGKKYQLIWQKNPCLGTIKNQKIRSRNSKEIIETLQNVTILVLKSTLPCRIEIFNEVKLAPSGSNKKNRISVDKTHLKSNRSFTMCRRVFIVSHVILCEFSFFLFSENRKLP